DVCSSDLRGVPLTLTMLTLSDRWLTTHTSLSLRTATATGSRPTVTRPANCRPLEVTLKISSVLLGVLTAYSLVPSADMAIGRTCPLSNAKNSGGAACATPVANRGAAARIVQDSAVRTAADIRLFRTMEFMIGSSLTLVETRRYCVP